MLLRLNVRGVRMEELNLESKEFKRVMHNLRLENMTLPVKEQEKVLELINENITITPTLIKDLLKYGEI